MITEAEALGKEAVASIVEVHSVNALEIALGNAMR
jgi:hypothetical protein